MYFVGPLCNVALAVPKVMHEILGCMFVNKLLLVTLFVTYRRTVAYDDDTSSLKTLNLLWYKTKPETQRPTIAASNISLVIVASVGLL